MNTEHHLKSKLAWHVCPKSMKLKQKCGGMSILSAGGGTPPSRENPIFKLSASVAASKFCVWVQVGSDVYILDHRCQVKPHSSPSFSAACAAAIVHRNHFFICTNRINLLNVLKSRQAINHYKIVLEAARFPYANKTKESITSQRLGSWDFWRINQ